MSHYLTVTADERDGYPPDVIFDCTEDESSACRNYPNAAEWEEGDADSVPQDECWGRGWFDADGWYLDGPTRDYMAEDSVPNVTDRFEVTLDYNEGLILFRVSELPELEPSNGND